MPILNPADDLLIYIYQGADFWLPLRLGDEDTGYYLGGPGPNGEPPADLTQWRSEFVVYPYGDVAAPPVVLLTTETTDPGTITFGVRDGGEFGIYNFLAHMDKTRTRALSDWGTGLYQIDIIDPMGHEQRVAEGPCLLRRGR